MPRLPIALVKQAKRIHPLLPLLLPPCRDLDSARNELRWLAEYQKKLVAIAADKTRSKQSKLAAPSLRDLCLERSRGRPLQYILGTQPFGPLEILCRKGVLIPRPETEAYTERLALLLLSKASRKSNRKPVLRILDLGTGTGCIPLLLAARLHPHYMVKIRAIDNSPQALRVARRNLRRAVAAGTIPAAVGHSVEFIRGDMTAKDIVNLANWHHVVICNPPYISPADLRSRTERSVRLFEPREALVAAHPPDAGLTIYEEAVAKWFLPGRSGICVVEFVDEQRARLFAEDIVRRHKQWLKKPNNLLHGGLRLEIWRENPRLRLVDKNATASSPSLQRETISTEILDNEEGAVRAIVGFVGHDVGIPSSFDVLKPGNDPRSVREEKSSQVSLRKISSSHDINPSNDSPMPAAPKSMSLSAPPTGMPASSNAPPSADMLEGLTEALNGVAELGRMVKGHAELHRELLAEQAKMWEYLRQLAQEIQVRSGQAPEVKRDAVPSEKNADPAIPTLSPREPERGALGLIRPILFPRQTVRVVKTKLPRRVKRRLRARLESRGGIRPLQSMSEAETLAQ